MSPPTDPELATWIAGGAIAGAFVVLWWIAKRWISMQENQFNELYAKVSQMDDKKLDIEQFNDWTKRVDSKFERLLNEQQRNFADSRAERQKQSEKLDQMLSSTQKFNLNMVERVARLERDK
tara:strand:+ start:2455 stop:2820 length:366 start_codon:yes stop_codon:yes gene_type:complete